MATLETATQETVRLVRRIQAITIGWMTIEASLSLWSAWKARSPALLAFGGDSAIELLSAIVVLWQFLHRTSEHSEKRVARIAGGLLFVLAASVVLVSVMSLAGVNESRPSYLGLAVLAMATLIMPWLAREKRRLSAVTGSAALRADAAESAVCFYLSVITLFGLAAHALFHIGWADPIAALAITPLIVYEGREAMRGRACGSC